MSKFENYEATVSKNHVASPLTDNLKILFVKMQANLFYFSISAGIKQQKSKKV